MMKKIFWEDPYQAECNAQVVEIKGKVVRLDQSVFYAFSGGQESDKGTIGGINVVEARKQGSKEDIIDIEYELESEPDFKVGDEVKVRIDVERRDKLRRYHSALHLLFYIVNDVLGKVKTCGGHVAEHKGRMDFEYSGNLNEFLGKLEEELNKVIDEDKVVECKVDESKADLRWWICGDWKMPCGGTHVKRTGEIGKVSLKRKNVGKGKQRIEVVFT